jgi:hypothetical protein
MFVWHGWWIEHVFFKTGNLAYKKSTGLKGNGGALQSPLTGPGRTKNLQLESDCLWDGDQKPTPRHYHKFLGTDSRRSNSIHVINMLGAAILHQGRPVQHPMPYPLFLHLHLHLRL